SDRSHSSHHRRADRHRSRATALAFAWEGARIAVSGRHDDKGKELVSELHQLGAEATFIKSDVRHEDEVRTLVDETVKRFGRLDVAVNNAGTEGKPGPLTDQTAASYAATFGEPEIKFYEHSNHVG